MKIIVFGASRGVGFQVVQQALEQGHEVTAFARNVSELPQHPKLHIFQGDALDPASVALALEGQQAVVCALGAGNTGQGSVRSAGTAAIVQAMQAQGLRRLLAVSSFGVGDSRKGLIANAAWLFLRAALEEHERQEKAITESGLDWTIVRPTGLTNDPKTGQYKLGTSGRGRIPRADVADFMVKQLSSADYLRKAVTIST